MMKGCLCIVFLMLFGGLSSRGQSLEGRVVDASTQEGVSGVSVIAFSDTQRPIAFDRTKADGSFSVNIPTGKNALYLTFKLIGYRTVDIDIDEFDKNSVVELEEETFTLNEVEVKPNKIRQQGDTLSYSVSAFKQKQDRSIADVISKMPGLEVMPSGEIRYQGKQINKFYIEGMDLLGSSYAIASENIRADMVKNVQVYQDHQPIKALKNVRFSDQAALNIVLKDEYKNIWQGNADIGAGITLQDDIELLRSLRLIGMMFSRKSQSISMYKTDNSGNNIEKEIRDLANSPTSLLPEQPITEDISISSPLLSSSRYRFNDTHILASNWLFKVSGDDDLRFQLRGIFDKSSFRSTTKRLYIDIEEDGLLLTEEQNARKYRNEWTTEIAYKRNKDNIYVNNSIKAYIDFNHSDGNNVFNQVHTPQNIKARKRFVTDDLEWIKSYSDNKSLSVSSHFIYNYLPATLLLNNGTTQHLGQHKAEWYAATGFRHKLSGIYITYNAGISVKQQKLNISNYHAERTENYSQQYLFIIPSVSYKNSFLRINAAVQMRYIHRKFEEKSKSNIIIEPNILLNYSVSGKLSTSLAYANSWNPLPYLQGIETPLFTNYYSMVTGDGMMRNTKMNTVTNNWQYNDIIKGLFGNVSLSYITIRGKSLYESSYSDNFYIRRISDLQSDDETYRLSGKIGKSIGWGKLSVALSASSTWNNYSLLINRKVDDFRQNVLTTGCDIAFHPVETMSFELNSSYVHNSRRQLTGSAVAYSDGYFNHVFKIYVMPKSWQIELNNEVFHSNDKSMKSCFFTDLSVSYRKKTWETRLHFNNIFGQSSFVREYNSTNQIVRSYNFLRQRDMFLDFSFSL